MIQASAAFTNANLALVKNPVYLIQIQGYARAFTNKPTGITGQYPWIVSIADLSITVSDMDGGADLGDLSFNVQDHGQAITADFPGFVFEGKRVTLKTGFVGMNQDEFITLFTGLISTVSADNANAEYTFDCVDIRQELTKVVYTTADDGAPTDSDHPRSLNGHPLDLLISLLENEIGLSPADIDIAKLETFRDGIYSGMQFTFSLTSPPAAKDFIENELMKPLGAYIWPNNEGKISVNFFYPQAQTPVLTLTRDNLTSIPLTEQADLINTVSLRFDQNADGKFFAESVQSDAGSVAKYGLYGQQVIESAGLRSAFGGFFTAALTSRLIFQRYGNKTLQVGGNTELDALWTACIVEPGDQLLITHPQVADRVAGVMGITAHTFEQLDRVYHFDSATVGLKLLDISGSTFPTFYIAPDCEPDFTAASDADKAHYLFQANDSDQYSDSTPANTLA